MRWAWIAVVGLAATQIAQAGTQCRTRELSPGDWAQATRTAMAVVAELDRHDAPVALVARSGTDLRKHGIRFSHVGFVVRDHPDGRWTVVHLLNRCGTDDSALHAEGLIDFYADARISQDTRIVWLRPARARALRDALGPSRLHALHEPHYNLIAHPDSRHFQNSTSWALEVLGASATGRPSVDRAMAQAQLHALAYRPFSIDIPYRKRIAGGLFAGNMHFTDHPLAARLSGHYQVVTVDSIFDWLDDNDWIEATADR